MTLLDKVKQQVILEGEAVYFDSVAGFTGTTHPIGTAQYPVNNELDLRVILGTRNLDKVVLRNSATVLQFTLPLVGITFISEGEARTLCPRIDFNGQAITCQFINLRITDTFAALVGTHTDANHATIMTDAAATFTPSALIGLVIRNTTDGCEGIITDNDGTTITCAGGLAGGTLNIWTTGDAYTVAGNTRSPSEFWDCNILTVIAYTAVTGANYHKCRFAAAGVTSPPVGVINLYDNCKFLGDLTNTTGVINAYGDLLVDGSLIQTNVGSVCVHSNCQVVNSIDNTSGSIVINGNCKANCILNTTGGIDIWGNCLVTDAISQNGVGYISISMDCQVSNIINSLGGTIAFNGSLDANGSIDNTGGLFLIIGARCKAARIINTTGQVTIGVSCTLSDGIAQTDTGTISIYGDCNIPNDLANTKGTINIYGDCNLRGQLVNTKGTIPILGNCEATVLLNTGDISIGGNCQIAHDLTNATGNIEIDGNCQIGANLVNDGTPDPTGTITISGNCQVGGNVFNTDGDGFGITGTLTIRGSLTVGGGIANTGVAIEVDGDCKLGSGLSNILSLTGATIKFTAPNPTLDLLLGATSVTERIVSRGNLRVSQMAAGATAIIDLCGGVLTIAADCTGGTITLYGDCDVVDLAAGAVTILDYRTGQQDTRFFQEAVAATDVDGTNWKDLLDRSVLSKASRICG